jgi:hypothetical protein
MTVASPSHVSLAQTEPAPRLSIILPAKNEADGLRRVLPGLRAAFPDA